MLGEERGRRGWAKRREGDGKGVEGLTGGRMLEERARPLG